MHSLHKLDLRSAWRHYPLFARDGADLAHYAEIFREHSLNWRVRAKGVRKKFWRTEYNAPSRPLSQPKATEEV